METGSFTAAADRLGVAKAVVSHQIGRLEEELGATLLQRTTRRVTPPDVTPRQSRSLAWVGNAQLRGIGQWLFSRDAETVLTEINPIIMCDKSPAALACVLAGIGLGIFPDYSVDDDIAEGRLVPVFA